LVGLSSGIKGKDSDISNFSLFRREVIKLKIEGLKENGGYILCDCTGLFGVDEFIEIINQAIRYSIEKGSRTLLVNLSDVESVRLDAFQRYTIGERIARTQLSFREIVRIAVVGREPLVESRKFAETVALNRGAKGKAFHDLQEAIAWIKTDEKDLTEKI